MDNTIISVPEISLDGFQVVSGSMFKRTARVHVPSITIWANCISFSKATIVALNNCDCIRIEVNPVTRRMLLVPVGEQDKDAIYWTKNGKNGQSKRIECIAFTSQLFEQWGWNIDSVYRGQGRLVTVEQRVMLLFDFSSPESWRKK